MKHFKKLILWLLVSANFNYLIANPNDKGKHGVHVTNIQNTTFIVDLTQVPGVVGKAYDAGKKQIDKKYQDIKDWLKNHKYIFVGIFATTAYSVIFYQLNLGKKILSDSHAWANWHSNTSLTDLINQPTNLISRELHQAILAKYSKKETADLLAPIVLFNCDLNLEIKALNTFCLINEKLDFLHMQKIFFTSSHELSLAQDKLNRLVYLKKVINESIQISLNK